jgi:two-component system, NarL family, nitrate/nitrite response regulator NarL
MIRVLLISEVDVNREGLASLLALDGRLRVAMHGAVADWDRLRGRSADVVVIDTATDGGGEAVMRVIDEAEAPIVALGAPGDDERLISLAELGVLGFVERDATLNELITSVIHAVSGEASVPPRIAATLLHRMSSLAGRPVSRDVTALTVRERQVVQLIAEGLSNKEIATQLCIELATVKNHVHNILEKLEVHRRAEAVACLGVTGRHPDAEGALLAGEGP